MEIKSAEFVISNTKVDLCPKGNLPEYAFIGRSNVGKSSLINMLTRKPKLAMTSATPGKTLLINHFLVNKEWYLVDLPGYGYAARGKKQVDKIQKIIEDYVLEREQMTNLFVLIDIRLEPQKIDLEFFEWLGENGVPFSIIFIVAIYFLGDVRSPIVIGLSMTVSVIVTFFLFYFFKVSLNVISLSGLILAVGMMIDNSIIVTENICEQYRKSGCFHTARC